MIYFIVWLVGWPFFAGVFYAWGFDEDDLYLPMSFFWFLTLLALIGYKIGEKLK